MKELALDNCRLDQRYDVHGRLGRGSYSEVFLARDVLADERSPHSRVVIKALNVFLQDDLDTDLERTLVENFQNEAIALDRVRHPNIVSRLGHGTARDLADTTFHYLVLEYLSGGNLQRLIREKPLAIGTCLFYLEQISAGLAHAHSRSIIHRDIKPQNLLLTGDSQTVKIVDFGVARVSAVDSPITRVGTNIYAPPEHSPLSAGQTGALGSLPLTSAADIYSLAKTVLALLTGESPRAFTNRPISSLPASIAFEPWSERLLTILRKATDDDPHRRYATIAEFWPEVAKLRAGLDKGDPAQSLAVGVPRPHISKGYSAKLPARPIFDEIDDGSAMGSSNGRGNVIKVPIGRIDGGQADLSSGDRRRSRIGAIWVNPTGKKLAAAAIALLLFAGILTATAFYVRDHSIPGLPAFLRSQTATANTDIYLRPTPNTDNDPIGLVTKNSRLKIVNSRDNWYQVDVVSQGRQNGQAAATRGWLNGKYIAIDDN